MSSVIVRHLARRCLSFEAASLFKSSPIQAFRFQMARVTTQTPPASSAQTLPLLSEEQKIADAKTAPTPESPSKKPRPIKKKYKPAFLSSATPSYTVRAYATADYYDLETLRKVLIQSAAYEVYDVAKDLPDDCICVKAKYALPGELESRHIFMFEDGTVVFWNVSKEEEMTVLDLLRKNAEKPYPAEIVNEESEMLSFSRISPVAAHSEHEQASHEASKQSSSETGPSFIRAGSYSSLNTTRLINSHIYFKSRDKTHEKEYLLEKYAFSDAIALSVKLGIWEKRLEQFAEKIEYLTEDLKRGSELKLTNRQVLMKLGELFTMRHTVNLYSNFLDTPDFYWDREHLEHLYSRSTSYLSVYKRTKIFNDKLSHCIELMEILKQNLTDAKHTRLEWIIIYLIAIEVAIAFGLLDLLKSTVVNIVDKGDN